MQFTSFLASLVLATAVAAGPIPSEERGLSTTVGDITGNGNGNGNGSGVSIIAPVYNHSGLGYSFLLLHGTPHHMQNMRSQLLVVETVPLGCSEVD